MKISFFPRPWRMSLGDEASPLENRGHSLPASLMSPYGLAHLVMTKPDQSWQNMMFGHDQIGELW